MNATRDKVIQSRLTYPELTLAAIGDKCGVSRERVRQILKVAQLPTKSQGYGTKTFQHCPGCNKQYRGSYTHYCASCRHIETGTLIPCAHCGKLKLVPNTLIRYRAKHPESYNPGQYFCKRTCFLGWVARTAGFRVNPQNSRWKIKES